MQEMKHVALLQTIACDIAQNVCLQLLDFSIFVVWVEGSVPKQAAPANGAPIEQQQSYKMAQAIFEVLEGRIHLLITT